MSAPPQPLRIAGFGARPGAGLESLRAAYDLAAQGRAADALATIPERAESLRALAAVLDLPLHLVQVAGVKTPSHSARVMARFGTGSVAEAAALVAAGPGARIIVRRTAAPDGMATCAVATGETT